MESEIKSYASWLLVLFTFFLLPNLNGGPSSGPDTFWSPAEPPKSHYVIDARLDLEKGVFEGKESISLKNNSQDKLTVVAFDWSIGPSTSLAVAVRGKTLALINSVKEGKASSPLFFRLSEPLKPGATIKLEVAFKMSFDPSKGEMEFQATNWHPRLWWDGLPLHDSFSVKIDLPKDYVVAASGRLDPATGRYEAASARNFGIYLGKSLRTQSREVEGVFITTLFTEKGAPAAAVCLDTAVDAVKFFKGWLGFYPFKFLSIIPGGKGRWGGYPVATGIVAIHGEETFKEGEPHLWWQWITTHEIGHQYWGEWVLDPDDPAWVWIGMGIFADTEYLINRKIDPERRVKWMENYLDGVSGHYDTTLDIPPAQLSKIQYDHNNTVIHSKGPSVFFALDSVLGRPAFEKIYKKALREYGGRRLGWREFRRFCERETGQDLTWFFDQWVRSNAYLCYKIESQESRAEGKEYLSVVAVKRMGTMKMPVPVKAVFEDGTDQVGVTDRGLDLSILTFHSQAELKEVVLDPEKKLAMLKEPLPEISAEAAEMLSLGWSERQGYEVYEAIKEDEIASPGIWLRLGRNLYETKHLAEAFQCFKKTAELSPDDWTRSLSLAWMGLLKDLLGEREAALGHYREALKFDWKEPVDYGALGIRFDRDWLEQRLKKPFVQPPVEIPAQPTAEELQKIVAELNWEKEGKIPFLVYEKAKNLKIDTPRFWFKLGLLLFDSRNYRESFAALERVSAKEASGLMKFTALTWLGHLKDLLGEREEALKYYNQALEFDTGETMRHDQWGLKINREWVEKRLKMPFTWKR